jgi:hypothetical protein
MSPLSTETLHEPYNPTASRVIINLCSVSLFDASNVIAQPYTNLTGKITLLITGLRSVARAYI